MDSHQTHRSVAANSLISVSPWIWLALAALASPGSADADNFGRIYYDKQTDKLVVTMLYSGTNPHHDFSLKWGECQANQSGGRPGVTVEVLDDQFDDVAEREYRTVKRFSLAGLPCPRPASVTLHTAPRFFYTLTIP
jgi:hypothetical protein